MTMDKETLFQKAVVLPREERKKLALRLMDSMMDGYMDEEDRYSMLVSKAEVATGHELTAKRNAENTLIRRFVATRLRKEGFQFVKIGYLMNRDHSSVMALVNGMQDILSLPNAYKEEISQYNLFNKLVEEFDKG